MWNSKLNKIYINMKYLGKNINNVLIAVLGVSIKSDKWPIFWVIEVFVVSSVYDVMEVQLYTNNLFKYNT